MRRSLLTVLVLALTGIPAVAQTPAAPAPKAAAPARPWFVDDEKYFDAFIEQLTALAKDGKCLATEQLTAKLKPGRKARVTLTKPDEKRLAPEEVYRRALPSVFVIGSVHKDEDGDWVEGIYATAWVAAADGVLVTNWHVFEELEKEEVFGAVDHKGTVYPVVDFLGGDKVADVAVVRVGATGLTPLPVADGFADVGSWAAVLGHPGDNYFVYTQGHVTRYSTNKNDDGKRERWMGLTAEYAGGSSGSPVLDRRGAVVGMAAMTVTIGEDPAVVGRDRRKFLVRHPARRLTGQPPIAPPPREKDEPAPLPLAIGPQMILKLAVPAPTVRRSLAE